MPDRIESYDIFYDNYASELYRKIRLDTYRDDLGQTSWTTAFESQEIPRLLKLTPYSQVLEIGCGSGGYAVYVAERSGCHITGIDISALAIRNANRLARAKDLTAFLRFERADATKKLCFNNETFDAVFSNDTLCHLPNRPAVLAEIFRVLKPGSFMFFSDALILGGLISKDEFAERTKLGPYVLTPPGENERLIAAAAFNKPKVKDTTQGATRIAAQWREARKKRKRLLLLVEGDDIFAEHQRFLSCVHKLTSEKRLLRRVYLAQKP